MLRMKRNMKVQLKCQIIEWRRRQGRRGGTVEGRGIVPGPSRVCANLGHIYCRLINRILTVRSRTGLPACVQDWERDVALALWDCPKQMCDMGCVSRSDVTYFLLYEKRCTNNRSQSAVS